MRAALSACLLLAAASLALPSEPSYDPWAWLVWGRELGNGTLDTAGGPSWKPGSVAVTVPLAPLGAELAPALWLLLVRAAGLLSLVLAARLAARLARAAGTSSAASNATAGALAAALLALSPGWWRYLAHGNEVPLALALGLGATELHPERPPARRLRADRARAAPAPEAAALAAAYCAWLWARQPAARPLMIGIAAGVLALWLVPEWAGSGDPLGAFRQAAGRPSWSLAVDDHPWRAALGRAHSLAGPVVEAGLVTALILRLRGSPASPWPLLVIPPAGAALVVAMTQAGLFGQRALLCAAAGGRLRRRRRRPVGPVPPSADSPLRCSRRPGPCNPRPGRRTSRASCARSGPSRPCTPASSAPSPALQAIGPPAANRLSNARGMADTPIDHRDRARWPAADGAGRAGAAGRAARAAGPSRPAGHPPRRANR